MLSTWRKTKKQGLILSWNLQYFLYQVRIRIHLFSRESDPDPKFWIESKEVNVKIFTSPSNLVAIDTQKKIPKIFWTKRAIFRRHFVSGYPKISLPPPNKKNCLSKICFILDLEQNQKKSFIKRCFFLWPGLCPPSPS